MREIPTLRGARVLLRPWRDSDRAPFARLNADPAARLYFPTIATAEQSNLEADRIAEHFEREGFGLWALEIPGVTEFAGFVGLMRPSYEAHFTPCVEVGWRLLPDYWRRGYASEAAELALAYGFEVLGLDEIVSLTTVTNQPSRRVMDRIGLRRDPADDFDHPRIAEGHPLRPHVLYRLSRADWQQRKQAEAAGSLFAEIPAALPEELIQPLFTGKRGFRVERIVSHGQASPPDFWYEQAEHEWVLLVSGSACLEYEQPPGEQRLLAGDHVLIPAGRRHRVKWTQADTDTVWLAVFYQPD